MRRVRRRVHLGSQQNGAGPQRTYLAPRDKVYRFIDEMVEGTRSQGELLESLRRWWNSIPLAEREIVRKDLLNVLAKSNATIEALSGLLTDLEK
jgi:hypothetical protein